MGGGFTKLVPEIIQSSIWNEPSDIRVVWITMLAIKDEGGYVRGDAGTIARLANVPTEAAVEALAKFQQPDLSSHTPDNDGRRIEAAPGGWIVLNHHLYRTGDRNEYMKQYMREYRKKRGVDGVNINVNQPSASASVSVSRKKGGRGGEGKQVDDPDFERVWTAFGKYGAKAVARKYWRRLSKADRAAIETAVPQYLLCVEAGRTKKQFEGWINPQNRLWEMDWSAVLADLTKPEHGRGGVPVAVMKEMFK